MSPRAQPAELTAVPAAGPAATTSAVPGEPTLETCRAWLASSQEAALSSTFPAECPQSSFREALFARGGGAFPVGDDRYYLVLFPDTWETVMNRRVVVSLHGTGGCAEWMLNHWYQTAYPAHPWALVALQYYHRESGHYDDDEVIYRNLQLAWDDLRAHCPVEGSQVFYHGFSRGSAQSFPVAVRDRAASQIFSSFIADSGSAGLTHPTLRDAPAGALDGARLWMWCGENDVSTVDANRMTCQAMEEDMRPYVEGHGGQVDALVQETGVAHGMFNGCPEEGSTDCSTRTAQNLGPSLPLLFDYIESFR
jgi:hypothetical protein